MYEIYNKTTKQSFEIHCGSPANASEICTKLNSYRGEGVWDYKATEKWKSYELGKK